MHGCCVRIGYGGWPIMFGIGWDWATLYGRDRPTKGGLGGSTDCSLSGVSGPQLVEEQHRTRVTSEERASRVVTSRHCESA